MLTLELLADHFTVCQPAEQADINWASPFVFAAKTDTEISLVCPTAFAPAKTQQREDGWRALRVQGVLDFSLTGIMAGLAGTLAKEKISIFAVSTFNTDYLLVRSHQLTDALQALQREGYQVIS